MDFNKLIPHVNFGNTIKSDNYWGSCAFSGATYFASGYDYVGFQVGDDVDKWQITAIGNLKWRQNDSGRDNTASWGAWRTIIDSSNCGSYNVNTDETIYADNRRSCINFGSIYLNDSSTSYTLHENCEYILNINSKSNVNITLNINQNTQSDDHG